MLSPYAIALFQSQAHAGEVEDATHRGTAGEPGCGPYIVMTLRIEEGVVREARYRSYGCPVMMACGEIACRVAEGRSLAALRQLDAADVRRMIDGVPEGKEHCPELAAEALARMAPRKPAAEAIV